MHSHSTESPESLECTLNKGSQRLTIHVGTKVKTGDTVRRCGWLNQTFDQCLEGGSHQRDAVNDVCRGLIQATEVFPVIKTDGELSTVRVDEERAIMCMSDWH